jgi:ketosteroid isomerase-like protein
MAKTNTQTIGSVLNDIYDAWRAQNLDWLATYLPDDFSHRINIPPAMHPLGGERVGKKAVLERLSLIFSQFETQRLSTSHLVIDGGNATLEVTTLCVHRPTGAHLDTQKRNVWTMEDGWPAKLDEHYDLERFVTFMQSASE